MVRELLNETLFPALNNVRATVVSKCVDNNHIPTHHGWSG